MPDEPKAAAPQTDAAHPGARPEGEPDIIHSVERQLEQVHTARAEQKRLLRDMLDQQEALEQQDNEIAERARSIEERAASIDAREAEIDSRAAELDERADEIADNKQALHEMEESLAERERAADEQKKSFEAQFDEIRERTEALKAEMEAFAETRSKLEEELAGARTEAQHAVAEKEEIEEARSVLEADNSRLRGELAAAEAAGASADAANKALSELRASLEARDAQVAKLNEKLEKAKSELESAHAAAADGDAVAQQLSDLQKSLAERDEKINELTTDLDAARSAAEESRAAGEETTELRTQLEEAQRELEDLRNAPQAEPEPVSEQVAKRDQVIETLTAQLRDAETKLAAASKGRASTTDVSKADLHRRDRLKAIRNSLRDKAARLSQAKQMIDQRQEEVDGILRLRSELASQREALQREREDIGKHSTKAGAGVAVICAAIAVLILAPVSWKVASIFAPADHLATATIELVSRDGSQLPAERLTAFRASVDELATDPKVVDQTASRMSRRGIETYTQPAALSAALNKHLDVSHPRPGAVDIAFTDKGSLQTQRALETYIAALVSATNDRASARMDSATVIVSKAPEATTPVSLQGQAIAAAGVWAGSSFLMLIFLSFVAVAMTKARERIRNEEAMLQSARDGSGIGWGLPGSSS